MLVFAKKKMVLLSMPKTGTTALEEALGPHADIVLRDPPNLKHTTAHRYNKLLRPYLDTTGVKDLELVCVLRHPISWLGSWFRYRSRPYKDGHANSTKNMAFDDFVNEYQKGKPEHWARVGHPEDFIRLRTGEMIVDHLFQYEQLDKMVLFLQDRLEMDINLRERNVSPQRDLTLSEKTEAKLKRKRPDMFSDWEMARR